MHGHPTCVSVKVTYMPIHYIAGFTRDFAGLKCINMYKPHLSNAHIVRTCDVNVLYLQVL